jgi:non-heme chloroperoxidase
MNRRDMLASALALAGAGYHTAAVQGGRRQPRGAAASSTPGPYVRTRDGESLFYKDWGSGRPIVFLGAWGLPSAMWDYQMVPLFQQGFRCVAYDRRGHGRSSHPGGGYDYDTLSDDLAAVLDALDLRDVILVGMSMAGGEMVRYLSRHGSKRVARLVFVATAATPFVMRTPDNPDGLPAELFEGFRSKLLLRDYPKWLEDNRAPFFVPETSPQMQEWVRTLMLGNSLQALVACNRSQTSTDFRVELTKIALPTLVIHGDKDVSAALERTGKPTAAMIPGARLIVYEGAPHGLFLTHMERLNADLLAFAKG